MAVDEALVHALDNAINAMVDQWIAQIHAEYAAYRALTMYFDDGAKVHVRENLAVLQVYRQRYDDAGKLLATSEGRFARRRAARAFKKASLLYALAQQRLALAEASSEYYTASLGAAERVRDEAIMSRRALGAELKQRVRLELAKRLHDASSADVFIQPSEFAERIWAGSDHLVKE